MSKQLSILVAFVVTISAGLFVSGCSDGDAPEVVNVLELPEFETTASAVEAAKQRAVEKAETDLAAIVSLDPGRIAFDTTLVALDRLEHAYTTDWGRLFLLKYAGDDLAVREAAAEAVVAMEQWYVENIELNFELYQVVAAFADSESAARLAGERKRLLDITVAEFERRGMALADADRSQLAAWQGRLAELTAAISTNITNAEGIVEYAAAELDGLSEQQLATLEYDAERDVYIVRTAIRSQYYTILGYANDAEVRRRALAARHQRARDANGDPILEVVQIRQQIAALLGFDTWADYRTAGRMAGDGATAYGFIRDLGARLDDQFRAEQLLFRDLKRVHTGDATISVGDLRREDIRFFTNQLMARDYKIDHELVAEYLEEDTVLRGIFDLYEELFDLEIAVEPATDAWADDVRVARISEAGGAALGAVYLDLHPREGKYRHFAMFSVVDGRLRADGGYQGPVNAIVGNFPVAAGDAPALWTFGNVNTMFHEFGHSLHHVLTRAEFAKFAGTNVPRDFVEVPSQMLERWLEDPAVMGRFAEHYETGEAMPEALLQSLVSSNYATIGHFYKRQVSWGLSDLRIHMYSDAADIPSTPDALYAATNDDYTSYYSVPDDCAPLAAFGHLFGGYDAGYYGYAWADAIAADLAARFRSSPRGFMDAELGAQFRTEILEAGNSRDPNESAAAFLGRPWNTDAFFAELTGPSLPD